jgi:hypothetical protein
MAPSDFPNALKVKSGRSSHLIKRRSLMVYSRTHHTQDATKVFASEMYLKTIDAPAEAITEEGFTELCSKCVCC